MAKTKIKSGGITADAVETAAIKDLNVTVAKLPAAVDISGKTVTLPASVSGLGTGITNAQLAGSITDAKITGLSSSKLSGVVPTANLGTGTASSTTYLAGDQTYQTITEYNDNQVQSNIAMLGFKVATNGSLVKYNLVDQTIDDYVDDSGVDASASTNEVIDGGFVYGATGANPTGGTITEYSGFRVHTFTAAGSFITPSATGSVDVLLVGGGGAGGGRHGAGGGAGGMQTSAALSLGASTTFTATVGTGGASVSGGSDVYGGDGVDSSFSGTGISTITGLKGGGGAGGNGSGNGIGGDGTYGSGSGGYSASGSGGVGTSGQGYAGGTGGGTDGVSSVSGGGGGGSGAVGADAGDADNGGNGGAGVQNLYHTGVNQFYAGGGGGRGGTAGGTGGSGVGGDSADSGGSAGATNTGSGGGAAHNNPSGVGADGIIVIRYGDTEYLTIEDLTLQSTDTTASTADPNYGDMVCLIENAAGTATLNTDIKGYISEDSGVTSRNFIR